MRLEPSTLNSRIAPYRSPKSSPIWTTQSHYHINLTQLKIHKCLAVLPQKESSCDTLNRWLKLIQRLTRIATQNFFLPRMTFHVFWFSFFCLVSPSQRLPSPS